MPWRPPPNRNLISTRSTRSSFWAQIFARLQQVFLDGGGGGCFHGSFYLHFCLHSDILLLARNQRKSKNLIWSFENFFFFCLQDILSCFFPPSPSCALQTPSQSEKIYWLEISALDLMFEQYYISVPSKSPKLHFLPSLLRCTVLSSFTEQLSFLPSKSWVTFWFFKCIAFAL